MGTPLRALIVEDDPLDAELIAIELERAGFEPAWTRVETEPEVVDQLGAGLDVILADYTLPHLSAPRVLEILRQRQADIPLIVVTGSVGEEIAVRCMRGGAADYLLKDRLMRLGPAVRRALGAHRSRKERRLALAALEQSEQRHRVIADLASDYAYLMRALPTGGYTCEWLSGAFSRITGYRPEDLRSSEDWAKLILAEDRPVARRHLRRLTEGQSDDVELRIVTVDGRIRRVLLRGRPAIDEQTNRIVGFFGAAQDVTERHLAEQAAHLMSSAIEQAHESIMVTTAVLEEHGPHIVFVNSAFTELTGYGAAEAHGSSWRLLHGKKTDLTVVRQFKLALARGLPAAGQLVTYRKDGRELLVEWRIAPIRDQAGTTTHFVAIQTDVTDRVRMEQALRESEERYALAARGSHDGLWDWDLRSQTLHLSERWCELVGCTTLDVTVKPSEWLDRILPGDVALFRSHLGALIKGEIDTAHVEIQMQRTDGELRWMLVRGAVNRDAAGRPYRMAGSMADITDLKNAEAALVNDAFRDALTGLPNRTLLLDRISSALVRAQQRSSAPVGVLAIDLDRFKLVNDSLGFAAGDELLRAVAQRFESCVRASDTVARLGRDEFAVLLDPVEDDATIATITASLRSSLAAPFEIQGQAVYPAVSMGFASTSSEALTAEELLRNAITAMRHAKEQGRDRDEVYTSSMHGRFVTQLQLEGDLRRALERNELVVHYQPLVRASDQQPVALEALIRWNHSIRGMIPPPQLIAVAEETGLILDIGRWVADRAMEELRQWDAAGLPPVRLALNLSARELLQDNLVARVLQSLRRGDLDPTRLELELTETLIMRNASAAAILLRDLRGLGVRIAIDDFGTGYSSLAYLTDLPITSLKIDRTFVQKLSSQATATKVIRTIINMAHDLGLHAVAEGIETPEQRAVLTSLQCDELQGYLFSRPQPMGLLIRDMEASRRPPAAQGDGEVAGGSAWPAFLGRHR
jgi:diguanylate cyclase (GGDEF)-like protein/PAS domain S-box-containing protein